MHLQGVLKKIPVIHKVSKNTPRLAQSCNKEVTHIRNRIKNRKNG